MLIDETYKPISVKVSEMKPGVGFCYRGAFYHPLSLNPADVRGELRAAVKLNDLSLAWFLPCIEVTPVLVDVIVKSCSPAGGAA